MKIALIVLAIIGSAQSLRCFQCNADDDCSNRDFSDDIHDAVDDYYEDCDDRSGFVTPYCTKTTHSIPSVLGGAQVYRGCGYNTNVAINQCSEARAEGKMVEVCTCDTDGCNSASVTSVSVMIPMVLSLGVMRVTTLVM